jgi:hypothetical protein
LIDFVGKTFSPGVAIGFAKTPEKLSPQQDVSMQIQGQKT